MSRKEDRGGGHWLEPCSSSLSKPKSLRGGFGVDQDSLHGTKRDDVLALISPRFSRPYQCLTTYFFQCPVLANEGSSAQSKSPSLHLDFQMDESASSEKVIRESTPSSLPHSLCRPCRAGERDPRETYSAPVKIRIAASVSKYETGGSR